MPQGKRPTIDEFLQQPPAPRRPSIDEFLKTPVASSMRQPPTAPAQQPEGMFSSFQTGVAGPLLRNVVETAADFYNAPGETLERVGRAGLEFVSAFDPAGNAYQPTGPNAQRLAELGRRADERLPEPIKSMKAGMAIEEAKPRTRAGRIAGGVGTVLGEVAFPTAPETLAGNIITAPFAGAAVKSAGKFVAPILQRIRAGRNVGAVAEAAPTAAREIPPVTGNASPAVQRAMSQFEQEVARIKTLPPGQQAAAMEAAIQNIGREAGGVRPVSPQSRAGYPPPMEFPENPNVIQQAGRLPFEAPEIAAHDPLFDKAWQAIADFGENALNRKGIVTVLQRRLKINYDRASRLVEQMKGEAPAAPQIAQTIAGMARTPTSPVSLPEVRAEFPGLSKQQFDDEVLKAAEEGQIAIHRNDAPGLLSEAERNGMVKVGNDYYGAATIRGPAAESAAMDVGAAAAKSGPPGVTPEERAAALEDFLKTPGETSKAAGQQELFTGKTLYPAERTKFMEILSAFRKAGLLRITTHARNIGGAGPWQIADETARIPASILDIVLSPFTGRRTVTGFSPGAMARSAYAAATKGTQEAWQIIRKGATNEDIARLGLGQEVNTGNRVLDWYINGTFRLLAAEDRIFRVYAMRRSLIDRARSLALSEIRQGKIPRGQLRERFNELIKAPTADMAAGAVLDSEVATFNNANVVSDFINKGRAAVQDRAAGKVLNFGIDQVAPFASARAPTNIIARILEASPVGYGKNVVQIATAIAKRSFTPEQQRQFVQTFGRATMGSSLVALGWKGHEDGWLTGFQEDEPTKSARDQALGRTPGSIKIGDSWHQIMGFAPWASPLIIGATLAREADQAQKKGGSQAAAVAWAVPKAFGQAVLQQPMLQGTEQFIQGIKQPGSTAEKLLGATAASYIPGHVADIGQLIDYGTARQAQSIPERLMERIPGVRQMLPVRQNALGRPIEAPNPFNPLKSTTAQENMSELTRLDIGISGFQKKQGQSDEDLRAKTESFGKVYLPYYFQLVGSQQYQRASDVIRQDAIKTLNERAKELVEKGKERFARGPLSPAALVGAAIGSAKREAAKKNAARK